MDAELPKGYKGIVTNCPIPYEFFRTQGKGESPHQIHAGSYHLAMQQARIERANLIPYTSILPAIATELPLEEGVKRIVHGSEMKIIQAAAHVDRDKGEKRAAAGILYGWLHPKKRKNSAHIGGLVCEYNGSGTEEEVTKNLTACLQDLYTKPNPDNQRFSDDYNLRIAPMLFSEIEPKERFGTALTALAFVSYFWPIRGQNVFPTLEEATAFLSSPRS